MKRVLFLLLSIVPLLSVAQYRNPLDIKPSFAGNFGEVRAISFHAGLDFKTEGVEGKKVYATADGYVSRVAVSPYGYGKVVYITHPSLNNSVTVYAHLSSFSPEIDKVVKAAQYSKKSYRVDISPTKGQLTVKSGDVIALSGNTGSSGGPHVHFEVREGGLPVNSLAKGYFSVPDTIPPRISNLYLIEVDTVGGLPLHRVAGKYGCKRVASGEYKIEAGSSVKISKASYLAFEITDRKSGVSNTFGTYQGRVYLEGKQIFGYSIDQLSYTLMKYVNTLKYYPLDKKLSRSNVIRAYISPNNKLRVYDGVSHRGVIRPSMVDSGEAEAVFVDDCGNSSRLSFVMERSSDDQAPVKVSGDKVEWLYNFEKRDDNFSVEILPGTLFESAYLNFASAKDSRYKYSDVVAVGGDDVPLSKPYTLTIKPDSAFDMSLLSKAVIVSLTSSGGKRAQTTTISSGKLSCKPTAFGRFTIDVDRTSPRITPLFNPKESQSKKASISFKITDDLSGVTSYSGYIDGSWVLFEYEPKENRVTYTFDEHITKGVAHKIKLVVSDAKGNSETYSGEFTY